MSAAPLFPAHVPTVLVVDDVEANRELLDARLHDLGYDVRQARDGIEALEAFEDAEPDLVLLDVDMPRLDGITVCRRIKAHPLRRLVPVVLLTAHQDRDTRLRGLAAGADDFLSKPFDPAELRVRTEVLLRDRELNKQLDAAEGIVMALARVVEARDRYTVHHAERVGLYAREIGRVHGVLTADLDVLYKGGVMHDLGKAVIPADILLKRGALSDVERALMECHPTEALRIIEPLRSMARFAPIIRHHHERVDGTGYPDHLPGDEIPLAARIVGIADGWDAMTSDRPYRSALEMDEALHRLRAGSGSQWDAQLVDTFIALLDGGLAQRVQGEQLHVTERMLA
ncbi:MAG: response regulator [Chloroflexota bacterium]|nr:response regulator [Chloroflexota bacterium]MDE3193792.1 response regulator [Chloroflexota bacterium]